MSWLLVACVPGLLMLAALGLGRLETDLVRDAASSGVDEFVDGARAVDVRELAREGMPEAVEYLHRCEARRGPEALPAGRHAAPSYAAPLFATDFAALDEPRLPTRNRSYSPMNPQFNGTRDVNRV
ncbi:hypothetical protein H7K15_22920 [Mycobacterium parmense]|nr:hypothetical protein [Mycobacterium parmense]ORW57798.1 hypothetical protein AWC20_12970 [Mycobacterium parmense]